MSSYLDAVLGTQSQQGITGAPASSRGQVEKKASADIANRYQGQQVGASQKTVGEVPATAPDQPATQPTSNIVSDQGEQNRALGGQKMQAAYGVDTGPAQREALAARAGIGLAAFGGSAALGSSLGPWGMFAASALSVMQAAGIFGGSGENVPKEKDIGVFTNSLQLSNIIADPKYYDNPQNQITGADGVPLSKQEAIQKLYHDAFSGGKDSYIGQSKDQMSQFGSKDIQKMIGQFGVDYDTLKKSVGYDIPDFSTGKTTYGDFYNQQLQKTYAEAEKRYQEGSLKNMTDWMNYPTTMPDWNFWTGTATGSNTVTEKKQIETP